MSVALFGAEAGAPKPDPVWVQEAERRKALIYAMPEASARLFLAIIVSSGTAGGDFDGLMRGYQRADAMAEEAERWAEGRYTQPTITPPPAD